LSRRAEVKDMCSDAAVTLALELQSVAS